MLSLAGKPVFLSLILVLPLWVVLDNFIVAAIAALLLSFLVAMCNSLYILKRSARQTRAADELHNDD